MMERLKVMQYGDNDFVFVNNLYIEQEMQVGIMPGVIEMLEDK